MKRSIVFTFTTPTPCSWHFSFTKQSMFKRFAHCSLPDLVHSICAAVRLPSARAFDPSTAQLVLPSLRDPVLTTTVLQRHPLVRGANGLACTGTAESKHAWCSMLRDLFRASGLRQVSDAVLIHIYIVCM